MAISETEWFEHFGFQRFPFDRPEAGNEEFSRPEFLASTFVEPSCFSRILGLTKLPSSSILFADRGCGKTACRVMLEYYTQQRQLAYTDSDLNRHSLRVLSVPHIYLQNVVDKSNNGLTQVKLDFHIIEILQRSVVAFVNYLARDFSKSTPLTEISLNNKVELTWMLHVYGSYLSQSQIDFINEIDSSLIYSTNKRNDSQDKKSVDMLFQLLSKRRKKISPIDHLSIWVKVLKEFGVSNVYVLVDGVDEVIETAANPRLALNLIRPVLASLRLMDGIPHLAFKFFLPKSLESLIQLDGAIRKDRGFIFEQIRWSSTELIEILRRRLDALQLNTDFLRDRTITAFDLLCVPELRGSIEQQLVERANSNPRHLLLLCGLMVTAHCQKNLTLQNNEDKFLLNKEDLDFATKALKARLEGDAFMDRNSLLNFDIDKILQMPESEDVEFKSSMRWDYKLSAINKNLTHVIAKTIAGMLNSIGGVLIIGLSDEGEILGIDKDLATLAKPNIDGYHLALIDIVQTFLGSTQIPNLKIIFEKKSNKLICVVSIKPSAHPVFLTNNDTSEFWVRLGNSTRKLNAQDQFQYIGQRWGKY